MEETSNEWLLNQPIDIQTKFPALNNLLTDNEAYSWLPRRLPDGRYNGTLPPPRINPINQIAIPVFICLIAFVGSCVAAGVYWRVDRYICGRCGCQARDSGHVELSSSEKLNS